MKKRLITLLILLALVLAGCSGLSSKTQASSTKESTSLTTVTELVVGTLKLEGTQEDVTSDQAEELLILWKAYRAVSNSDTAAQAEIDALIKQIQGTMTTEQMATILSMHLSQQDVSALIQEQEIELSSASSSTTLQNTGNSAPTGGGDLAGGAPPDMGGIDGLGQTVSSSQSQAATAGTSIGNVVSPTTTVLVEAVIQELEQKTNA